MITDLLLRLNPKARRGSKPRCHLLTHGSPEKVSARLTQLITPWGQVDTSDKWMPQGFINSQEAQLGKADIFLDSVTGQSLVNWWLAVPGGARVPNWDIASTCTLEDKPGLLLIEAKAHDEELNYEKAGKKRERNETMGQMQNREQIRKRMQEANAGFANSTQLEWALSIEHHYQMSNRFAWTWKLTELGIPIVLIYLGFLNAIEMSDRGVPLCNHTVWEQLVLSHSEPLFSNQVWNKRWTLHGQPFIPLIKSIEQPLNIEAKEADDED
jgi:hypothetical protein